MQPPKRRLGEVLLEHGSLTPEALDNALELQSNRGGRLGEVLLAEGMVQAVDLVRALADQFGFEFADLRDTEIDQTLMESVPLPLARRHRAIPLREESGLVVVAMVNPADIVALDDLRALLRRPLRPVMVDGAQLAEVLTRVSSSDEQVRSSIRLAVAEAREDDDQDGLTTRIVQSDSADAPIIRFVDLMVSRAVQERASDIHVEPTSSALRIRFRIDGVLHESMHPPRALHAGILSRIKVMSGIDIAEKRIPQDGRVSLSIMDRSVDLRVATMPTVYGEAAVLRILRRDDGLSRVADLRMRPDQLARFEAAYRRPWGLVLVTGPTGSGKTTTLYSVLRELNEPTRNLMTVEDPVEYRLDGIKQVQVKSKVGLTFAAALRAMLRADPDVILVGEIRDRETAITAAEASLTGHLVLASLHTNDASSAALRLVEMGVEPYLVVAGIRGVLAQRLARRLCPTCRVPHPLGREAAAAAGLPEWAIAVDGPTVLHEPGGCAECSGTGFLGRFAVTEFLDVTESIAHLILERAPSQQIARVAMDEGMVQLRDAGVQRVLDGTTSLAELYRALG
ncbi:MAG: ATPase, T2SS/T4P/T4SS family [Microthrixaceae bacterium]